jgi:chemotaxis protein CheC
MDMQDTLTENQIDLLQEALNIGAGNAVTALSQLLQCDTDMSFPVMDDFQSSLTSEALRKLIGNNTNIEMSIIGELQGGLVIIIHEDDELKLTNMIRYAKEEQRGEGVPDISLITEIANIMAGVFLTAIHDFCKLNIFHSIPIVGKGVSDSLVNVLNQPDNKAGETVLLITNEFIINNSSIRTYLIMILSTSNSIKLIKAIEDRRTLLNLETSLNFLD